jgi:hypothetical protein
MKEHPLYKDWAATESGDVYRNGIKIAGTITSQGYRQYCINRKSILGHRFVYECNYQILLTKDDVINHLDTNRSNNHISNLELTTQKGNVGWFWADKNNYLIKQPEMIIKEQHQNSMAKLTREQAKEVIMLTLEGWSNDEIAKQYGLHSRYVSLIRHKKRWKKVWVELGLERSETIPSGSRHEAMSKWCQS